MPDARLEKARATLPSTYRFGDAAPFDPMRPFDTSRISCRHGCHIYVDPAVVCLCGAMTFDPHTRASRLADGQ